MSSESLDNSKSHSYVTLRSRIIKKTKRRSRSLNEKYNIDNTDDIKSTDLSQVNKQLNKSSRTTMSVLNLDVALKIIPDFDGSTDRLHKFLLCCDMVYNGLLHTEYEKFLNLIKTKLSYKAYDIVKYTDYGTWKELKDELKNKFQCSKSIEQLQIELINIRQQRTENVTAYASRVEKLLSELNEVCIASEGTTASKTIVNLNSKTALKAFQEGLLDPIKLIIKACRFTTLQDSINKACEEELILSTRNTFHSYDQTNKVKCQICKRVGHSAEKCYNRYPEQKTQVTSGIIPNHTSFKRYNETGRHKPEIGIVQKTLICAYCKAPGHHISICRKRQFVNTNKQNEISNQNIQSSSGNASGSVPTISANTPVRIQNLK